MRFPEHIEYVQVPRSMLESKGLLPVPTEIVGDTDKMPTFSALLKGFTYKPGYAWSFVIHETAEIEGLRWLSDSQTASLYLKCYVPDSTRPPHEPYLLQFQSYVGAWIETYDRDQQVLWLREVLRTFEIHEIDEWFRINGELVNNPHA